MTAYRWFLPPVCAFASRSRETSHSMMLVIASESSVASEL